MEVKIGGERPFGALYNDVGKLGRLIEGVQGRDCTFRVAACGAPPVAAAAGLGGDAGVGMGGGAGVRQGEWSGGTAVGSRGREMVVRFAPRVLPVYLVVADSDAGLEGPAVLDQVSWWWCTIVLLGWMMRARIRWTLLWTHQAAAKDLQTFGPLPHACARLSTPGTAQHVHLQHISRRQCGEIGCGWVLMCALDSLGCAMP